MRDVFMICVDVNFCTMEHGTEFLECFNNGKWFFFDCSVILLGFAELAGENAQGRLSCLIAAPSWKSEASDLM